MSANQLFHVPGVGDFPLEKVELIEERVAKHKKKNTHTNSKNSVNTINDLEMGETRQETLETFVSDPKRESRSFEKTNRRTTWNTTKTLTTRGYNT